MVVEERGVCEEECGSLRLDESVHIRLVEVLVVGDGGECQIACGDEGQAGEEDRFPPGLCIHGAALGQELPEGHHEAAQRL